MEFHSAGSDFREIIDGSQSNSNLFLASLRETRAQFDALLEVSKDADVILGVALQFAAPTVAEMLGIQYRYAVFSPIYLRSVQLPLLAPGARQIPAFVQRLLWRIEDSRFLAQAGWLNTKRRELGLSRIGSLHKYLLGNAPLGAFDPVLAPLPIDALQSQVTGYWRRESTGSVSENLSNFLSRGAPPAYLGFGSMKHRDSAALLRSLAEAAIASGRRILVGAEWTQLSDVFDNKDCMVVHDVAHDILFPRVSVAIHHGGAGTTIAAALAGIPQIIIPHLGDQYYHGQRVAALGLGPSPIPLSRLTPNALVAAMNKVSNNPSYAAQAKEFAPPLRAREGSAKAVDLLV